MIDLPKATQLSEWSHTAQSGAGMWSQSLGLQPPDADSGLNPCCVLLGKRLNLSVSFAGSWEQHTGTKARSEAIRGKGHGCSEPV